MAGVGFSLRLDPPAPSLEVARELRAEVVRLVEGWLRWNLTEDASGEITADYLPEAREYARKHYDEQDTRLDRLTFTFPDFTGLCHLEQGLVEHWYRLALAMFAETLDLYVFAPTGARLVRPAPLERLLVEPTRWPVLTAAARYASLEWPEDGSQPAPDDVVLRGKEGGLRRRASELTAEERVAVDHARLTGLCACEPCTTLRWLRRDHAGETNVYLDPLRGDPAFKAAHDLLRVRPAEAARGFALARLGFAPAPPPDHAYHAACAHALAGDVEAAARALTWAFDDGWSDLDSLRTDDDLAPLRGHPTFAALLARGSNPPLPPRREGDPRAATPRAAALLRDDPAAAPLVVAARAAIDGLDDAGWRTALCQPPAPLCALRDWLEEREAWVPIDALIGLLRRG